MQTNQLLRNFSNYRYNNVDGCSNVKQNMHPSENVKKLVVGETLCFIGNPALNSCHLDVMECMSIWWITKKEKKNERFTKFIDTIYSMDRITELLSFALLHM